ncbi:DUF3455 domain-containing protein [Piscinibacter koreensis]|nr:DUF3455 domain-containing protein [Schlegelella koreensis]
MERVIASVATASSALLFSACSGMSPMRPASMVDSAALPAAIRVPAGETQKLWTVGSGEITYECREKKDMAGQHEWVFVGPVATLNDAAGRTVGRYYAGPTWEAADGSKVTAKQVAVAPGRPGSIPLQLVKADPATGMGAMQGVTYIQRLNTEGGVAPASACASNNVGARQQVAYRADYVFYGR